MKYIKLINEFNTIDNNIYHLSSINLDGVVLTPRIPTNFLTKNGFEDDTTLRISFATSIDGALVGLSQNLEGKEFFVHTPSNDVKVRTPSIKEVPDVKCTDEVWVLEETKLKLIGKILVGSNKEKPLIYYYGDKKAETYQWNYTWIEKNI